MSIWKKPLANTAENQWVGILLGWSLALCALTILFTIAFLRLDYPWDWGSVWVYRQKFFDGWIRTVWISAAALGLSSIIGFVTALLRTSRIYVFRAIGSIYVELIRGTPLLVQILIFFYIIADGYGIGNRYVVGILVLSFFAGAYIAEIFRAGLESVSAAQRESALAVGFTGWQTLRFVILPQAIRQTLPPLAGQFASLIKDSSLLSIISISEFTLNAQEVNSFTFSAFESYLPLAVGYLILTLPISLFSRRMEHKLRYA